MGTGWYTNLSNDNIPISSQSPEQMVDRVLELPERTRLQILSPVVRDKREHKRKSLR